MVIRSRASQDLRGNSRVIALMNCRFTHQDITYDAVVVDLSQKGAMLSSDFLPPTGSNVSITIQSNPLKKELLLSGKVTRGTTVGTDQGKKGRFVVHFGQYPIDLINLLSKLHSSKDTIKI